MKQLTLILLLTLSYGICLGNKVDLINEVIKQFIKNYSNCVTIITDSNEINLKELLNEIPIQVINNMISYQCFKC